MPGGKSADNSWNRLYTASATPKALAPWVRQYPRAPRPFGYVVLYIFHGVVTGTEFYPRHIGQVHNLAVRAIFEDNVAKLLFAAEAAAHVDRDQKFGGLRRGLRAKAFGQQTLARFARATALTTSEGSEASARG